MHLFTVYKSLYILHVGQFIEIACYLRYTDSSLQGLSVLEDFTALLHSCTIEIFQYTEYIYTHAHA